MIESFGELIGKKILIGLTYIDDENCVEDTVELYGNIIEAGERSGIVVSADNAESALEIVPYLPFEDGNIFVMPPDLSFIKEADKEKDYIIKSTNERVRTPDFLAMWFMRAPDNK